jgi:hypothetical protein
MSVEEIVQATGHSKSLIEQYLDLIKQLQLPRYCEETVLSDSSAVPLA